jgi:hypothetical protein
MRSLLHDVVRTGLVAGVASTAAALLLSRVQNGRAAPAMNAVSHMAYGGAPPADSGPRGRNFVLGSALHLGASIFWAAWFGPLAGRAARRRGSNARVGNAWIGAAATARAAYVVDYHVVPGRLRPGMEAFLSRAAVIAVYAALGCGFALAARPKRILSRPAAIDAMAPRSPGRVAPFSAPGERGDAERAAATARRT